MGEKAKGALRRAGLPRVIILGFFLLLLAAAGAALGLFYDILRAIRWKRPRMTRLLDALFCVVLLPALLTQKPPPAQEQEASAEAAGEP